jgi:aspartyl-tRNA synthetase
MVVTVNDDGNMVFWDLREPKGIVQKVLTTQTSEK